MRSMNTGERKAHWDYYQALTCLPLKSIYCIYIVSDEFTFTLTFVILDFSYDMQGTLKNIAGFSGRVCYIYL